MRKATARILLTAAIMLGSIAMLAAPASAQANDQRAQYTNGCTIVPDVMPWLNFRDACNGHDICYARFEDGHHEFGADGRVDCDDIFLGRMVANCDSQPILWRPSCYSYAGEYYLGVRAVGAPFYFDDNTVW